MIQALAQDLDLRIALVLRLVMTVKILKSHKLHMYHDRRDSREYIVNKSKLYLKLVKYLNCSWFVGLVNYERSCLSVLEVTSPSFSLPIIDLDLLVMRGLK